MKKRPTFWEESRIRLVRVHSVYSPGIRPPHETIAPFRFPKSMIFMGRFQAAFRRQNGNDGDETRIFSSDQETDRGVRPDGPREGAS